MLRLMKSVMITMSCAAAAAVVAGLAAPAQAQNSAALFWGVIAAPSGQPNAPIIFDVDGMDEVMPAAVAPTELNALLSSGVPIIITTIGSQNIITTNVTGDGNTVTVEADQTSSNTGAVLTDLTTAP